MPLNTGDIKVSLPIETWGESSGQRVRVYQFQFTIRGQGGYQVLIPMKDFTPQRLEAEIREKATALLAAVDAFA